jgi:hypothetical protein
VTRARGSFSWYGTISVALWLAFGSTRVAAGEPQVRVPLSTASVKVPANPRGEAWSHRLVVKFADEARVRTRHAKLVSETSADLGAVEAIAAGRRLTFTPLVTWPPSRLAALQARAQTQSGRAQPDLAGMMVVNLPANSSDLELERVGELLRGLPVVEAAWIETLGVAPPGDSDDPTPDLVDRQDYRRPDPGLDLRASWNMNLTGAGLRIADVEYGWNHDHEQFALISLNPEPNHVPIVVDDPNFHHGTAVVGVTSAPFNGFGITGAVPDATVHVFSELTVQGGSRRTEAILAAIDASSAGDVVMLEIQTPGSTGDFVPGEFDPSVWMATRLGADAGVVLVAAAGNGNVDLDGPSYVEYLGRGDSGAIIVGAGSGTTSRAKLSFSTYGSRVDVHGWGQNVFTAGYGAYAIYGEDINRSYTAQFNGTSSATPLVASACVALQQLSKEERGSVLSPVELRELLVETGLPQGGGGTIGPLPNVRAAAMALLTPERVAPVLTIVHPPDGTLAEDFDGLWEVEIAVEASDDSRLVDGVQLRINDQLIDVVDDERPFVFSAVQFPKGTWEVVAQGRDLWGNLGESPPITIWVGVDPPVDEPETSTTGGDTATTIAPAESSDSGESGAETSGPSAEETSRGGCSCTVPQRRRAPWLAIAFVVAWVRPRVRRAID